VVGPEEAHEGLKRPLQTGARLLKFPEQGHPLDTVTYHAAHTTPRREILVSIERRRASMRARTSQGVGSSPGSVRPATDAIELDMSTNRDEAHEGWDEFARHHPALLVGASHRVVGNPGLATLRRRRSKSLAKDEQRLIWAFESSHPDHERETDGA
jgi:hypothetical protein